MPLSLVNVGESWQLMSMNTYIAGLLIIKKDHLQGGLLIYSIVFINVLNGIHLCFNMIYTIESAYCEQE